MEMSKRQGVWLLGMLLLLMLGSGQASEGQMPDFATWLQELRAEALAQGISPRTLDEALTGVKPLERVVRFDRNQPEFKLTFARYFQRVVSPARVEKGRRLLREHKALLQAIQERYGVQPRFLVALWGMETDFGRLTGGFKVIDALVTLAYDPRRSRYFRRQLLDALRIIDQGHVRATEMTGSWAGAMGQTQFMPSTFLRYAVDFDGDGRKDLWRSTADALASGAHYLARLGWRGDQTWGREVRLPADFDPALFGLEQRKRLSQWQALGVRRVDGRDLPRRDLPASLIQLDGDTEKPRHFLVYDNYRAIMGWNKSHHFATSVGILSDRIGRRRL